MKTVADDCWQIAAKCEHWAEESQDDATRLAFRQMAKALAGLAFSEQFGPAEGSTDSEDLEATLSEHTPPSPSFEMPLAEHIKTRTSNETLTSRSMQKTVPQRSGYPYRHARRSLSDSPFYGAAKSARFDCFARSKGKAPRDSLSGHTGHF